MTRQEFFAYVQLSPNKVNVWYKNTTSPFEIGAVSVPVLDNTLQDNTNYLTQAQQIAIPIQSADYVTLDILNRQLVSGVVLGNSVLCFFFDVKPKIVTSVPSTPEGNVMLQILPAIDQFEFTESPYNVLHGSVEGVRTSTYVMQSDRYKIGTLANPTYTGPINIDLLLAGTATLANIQDSNYSTTGWINGRYEGSKTDRIDYKTDPASAGSIFQGAEFPSGSLTSQITYLNSTSQIIYKDLFYAGVGDVPGFYPVPSGYELVTDIGESSYIVTVRSAVSHILPTPQVGNLIRIGTEIMKINEVGYTPSTPPQYGLQVTRGYNSATSPHNAYTSVENVSPVQIYNISGNKLTGVPKGKVLVKQTGTLLKLDDLGYIVSSSLLS